MLILYVHFFTFILLFYWELILMLLEVLKNRIKILQSFQKILHFRIVRLDFNSGKLLTEFLCLIGIYFDRDFECISVFIFGVLLFFWYYFSIFAFLGFHLNWVMEWSLVFDFDFRLDVIFSFYFSLDFDFCIFYYFDFEILLFLFELLSIRF